MVQSEHHCQRARSHGGRIAVQQRGGKRLSARMENSADGSWNQDRMLLEDVGKGGCCREFHYVAEFIEGARNCRG